jgi:DNA-binding MarR family transcriptional regulator
MSATLDVLHGAVIDIIAVMNRPQRDERLLRTAGVTLDRALFPLLVGIQRFGPIGVVSLAEGVGRDYTTISRQVARLEQLGLIERRPGAADRRVREAVITARGKAMTNRLDAARETLVNNTLASWPPAEIDELARLLRNYADALLAEPPGK